VPAFVLRPAGLLFEMLRTDMRVSNTKASAELTWTPHYPRVADGLAAMTS
jgi:hypothetical protein